TYADKHKEAIELFEEVRSKHPDREREIIRDLAEQYKWDGQYEKAVEAYKKALEYEPDDIALELDMAQVLIWLRRHKEATGIYESLLKKEGIALDESKLIDIARAYVDLKEYNRALDIYSGIEPWIRKGPSLMIEWARVCTYADKHKEAIELFEEVRRDYPENEKELIRELAEQYKWDGQYEKSIETYKRGLSIDPDNMALQLGMAQAYAMSGRHEEAMESYDLLLEKDPSSIEALLGKAEILSWRDQLEAAIGLYKRVLELDSQNIHALTGNARILVWQGYYRSGIDEYEKTLVLYPDNLDALEGLAFAYHWMGNEQKSVDTLEHLLELDKGRQYARKLYYQIRNSRTPYASSSSRYSHDKNGLRIFSSRLTSGLYPEMETNTEFIYEYLRYSNPNHNDSSPVSGQRGGVGYSKRFSDLLSFDSYLYLTNYDTKDFTPFTTNTWLTFSPNDMWKIYLGYDRETIEDIDSVRNEIVVDSGSLTADFRPNRWWYFSAKYKRGYYNDGNTQDTYLGKVEYRIHQDPYAKLYYNIYYSDWDAQKSHGYFNPYSIISHALGLYGSTNITKKLFIEGQSSIGYEFQNPPMSHPTYYAALGLNYRISEEWLMSLRGEYFNARPDEDTDKGYDKRTAYLTLTYSGAEKPEREEISEKPEREGYEKLPDATEPARPVTAD
ncbi:MAG: tetratricopeptide repeat protein, partial [Candidatus Omnitrophica bacterium]|nr:tetratricopeptide repeat protein [Candidatus Omnitrophota bacterium]